MSRGLILLRHGETTYNATRRMQGQLDTELTELGVAQAVDAAHRLGHLPIRRILSSDLQRAARTAQIVAERMALPVIEDARLRETHLGHWQGKTHQEVDNAEPGQRAHWRMTPTWAPEGGETRVQVSIRARAVIDELMDSFPEWEGKHVLVVAHGGTISALTSNLLGLDIPQYPIFKGLSNTAASVLECIQGQWSLRGWNVGGEI